MCLRSCVHKFNNNCDALAGNEIPLLEHIQAHRPIGKAHRDASFRCLSPSYLYILVSSVCCAYMPMRQVTVQKGLQRGLRVGRCQGKRQQHQQVTVRRGTQQVLPCGCQVTVRKDLQPVPPLDCCQGKRQQPARPAEQLLEDGNQTLGVCKGPAGSVGKWDFLLISAEGR